MAKTTFTDFDDIMVSNVEKNKKSSDQNMVGVGIAIGVAVGVALGTAMNNVGAGIAIGIAIGAAVGAGLQRNKKPEDNAD